MENPFFVPYNHRLPKVNLVWENKNARIRWHTQCDCDCACSLLGSNSYRTLDQPITYYLELTPTCLNHCQGCGNIFIDRRIPSELAKPLSINQWENILENIIKTASLIKLTGGEPTTYPGFYQILDLLGQTNIPFTILTTGQWRECSRLLKTLERFDNFNGFLISLHGPDNSTHEAFTGTPGSFQKAVNAIKAAVREQYSVSISTVLVKPNLGRLTDIVNYVLDLGVNSVIFGRYIGRLIQNLSLDEVELLQMMREVNKLEICGLPVKYGNCIPQCFEASSSVGCMAGLTFCTIDPWGNMRPCNHSRLIAGNILEQSIEKIWWSETMESWRQATSPVCQSCSAYLQCHGGCHALAFDQGNVDPLMKGQIVKFRPIPQAYAPLSLYALSVPRKTYVASYSGPEYTLIGNGRGLSVSPETLSIIEEVNNNLSLAQIRAKYGDGVLSFVGGLYMQGLVDLITTDAFVA